MQSSSTQYMSMYVAGRTTNDLAGMQTQLVKAGDQYYAGNRAGDYSGISVDPSTGTFWAANEVCLQFPNGSIFQHYWSTWIANFTLGTVGPMNIVNAGYLIALALFGIWLARRRMAGLLLT